MAIEDQTSAVPASSIAAAPARSRLRGNLGVASIVFMVVAAASPLGVIGGPVPLGIAIGNGTGFPFTFVIATVVLLLFAVGFTTMTPYVKSAGAFYSYVDRSLGRAAGLGTGFAALLSYITLEAAVFGLIGPGVNSLLGSYGVPSLPWWIYAAVAFGVVVFLGYRNIELSGRVLAVLLVAEVLIVLVLDAVIVFGGNTPEGLSTGIVTPSAILSGAPGIGILFAILSFIGFEATAVFRDEARDPDRTIPRATYLSLVLIGVFYALSSWALISAVGDSKAVKTATDHGGTLLADVTQRYLGTVGEHIIQVLFVTSLFACILSFHNIRAAPPFRSDSVTRTPASARRTARRSPPASSSGCCCWSAWSPGSTRSTSSTRGWPASRRWASCCCWASRAWRCWCSSPATAARASRCGDARSRRPSAWPDCSCSSCSSSRTCRRWSAAASPSRSGSSCCCWPPSRGCGPMQVSLPTTRSPRPAPDRRPA